MVVQRTLDKIDELKERPHHERRAVARRIALGIVAFLILFWGFFQVRALSNFALRLNTPQESRVGTAETQSPTRASAAASAAAALDSSAAAPSGYTASSTNGTVQIIPVR